MTTDWEALLAALPPTLDKTISLRVSTAWLAEVDEAVAALRKRGVRTDRSSLIRLGTLRLIEEAEARGCAGR